MDAVQPSSCLRRSPSSSCILVDETDRVVAHDTKYNLEYLAGSCYIVDFVPWQGHLMEKIESGNMLHLDFSVLLFNTKYELLLQVSNLRRWCIPVSQDKHQPGYGSTVS
ncbi:hypothetical protein MLD38_039746 [Melastoma candidum]|uniref:Uncharacterized protein n=1 Tax=Melastoma candidum TaxID=119954 RepID=A0ACB9L3F5_9MYRT|nr:hypothetical protein MLD38_039746 [Melastoma candidum]